MYSYGKCCILDREEQEAIREDEHIMADSFYVTLEELIKALSIDSLYMPEGAEKNKIITTDINRPGLQLAGFFDYFDNSRVQVMGKVEFSFLARFTPKKRAESIAKLFATGFPAIIVTRGLQPFEEMMEAARVHAIPVLTTDRTTSYFVSQLNSYLNLQLAQRITRHGVFVEVYGEGILLIGESGVGKSEAAIELLKRGHRLISDDAVEIKRVSDKTLVGSAPDVIRHFMELRGLGIVNVGRLFGLGAVKETEKIDLVINLEVWDDSKQYDRLGMDSSFTEILGLKIPSVTIPVKPGRNLAVVIEVAAMNLRQKRMGYSAAEELNRRLMEQMTRQ